MSRQALLVSKADGLAPVAACDSDLAGKLVAG